MKPLRAPGGKPVTLDPVRPNAGVEVAYRRQLTHLVDLMCEDIEGTVTHLYDSVMAKDAGPVSVVRTALAQLRKRWTSNFDGMAETISGMFSNHVLTHTDRATQAALSKGGFSVPFKPTKLMQKLVNERIAENVKLIKSIPAEHFEAITSQVEASFLEGRGIAKLQEYLHSRHGVTRRRAQLIARDQNNKATAAYHRARQLSLGITKAKWRHTAASKDPRETHAEFDGEIYDVEAGHDFGDDFGPVQPGEAINCGCVSSSYIPGYDDEDGDSDE